MQSIVGILNCLIGHNETNMRELYEQGICDVHVVVAVLV